MGMHVDSSLNLLLMGNGILTLGLIFNQNETNKDSLTNRNSSASANPFENFTWGCVLVELILLLLQTKVTDF
jgi:hypothetical protein